jgi:hypothetical protein
MKNPILLSRRRIMGLGAAAVCSRAASQATFDFHCGFWVNLHHTLYNQADGKRVGRMPDLVALSPGEAGVWSEALDYYSRNFIGHDLLELAGRINVPLALKGNGAPRQVMRTLETAAPVYRLHWWPQHEQKNREWIDRVSPLIAAYENPVRSALARAYDTPWPKRPMRVEMSYYTTGVSAYTSLDPTLITVSSWSRRNEGAAALETVFHEAGHALIDRVRNEIAAAEQRRGRKVSRPNLWHAIIAYTSGEVVRRQVPDLTPYAMQYGLWQSEWPNTLPVLEKYWKPFLEGEGRFRDAIRQVVAEA